MKQFGGIVLLLLMLAGCSEEKTMQWFMEEAPAADSIGILYRKHILDGEVILYKDETGFRHAFLPDGQTQWEYSSNAALEPQDGFTWTMSHNPETGLTMFSGVITDPDIEKVIVKQKTVQQEARIVMVKQADRLWYTIFDRLPDPLKIEAYNQKGQLVWKEGVYEGGVFHGRVSP